MARLLFVVPTLSLTACRAEDDGGCIPYDGGPATLTYYDHLQDGGVPTNDNCLEVCRMRLSNPQSCEVREEPVIYVDGGTATRPATRCHALIPGGCGPDGRL